MPEAVAIASDHAGIDLKRFLMEELRGRGLEPLDLGAQLLSGDSLNTQEFATLAGDAANGVMFTNAAEARNLPSAQSVVAEFRKEGFEPEGYTLSTYAAIQLWAEAVAKAGTTEAKKVAETIHSGCWETIIGKLCYDPKGDLTSSTYVWYVFKDGKYSEAKSM